MEIKNYLSSMKSSNLNRINRKTPFTTPDDYFKSLEVKILQRVGTVEEKGENVLSPTLKKEIFTIPEDYFEQMQREIQEKTYQSGNKNRGSRPFFRRLLSRTYLVGDIAACLVLLIAVFGIIKFNTQGIVPVDSHLTVDGYSELPLYILDEELLIDTYMSLEEESELEGPEEEIENYLLNNVNETLLLNEI